MWGITAIETRGSPLSFIRAVEVYDGKSCHWLEVAECQASALQSLLDFGLRRNKVRHEYLRLTKYHSE